MTDLPPIVFDLVAGGRKIEAIKTLRDAFGLSLKDAKALADRIEQGDVPRPDGPASSTADDTSHDELAHRVRADLDDGNRIQAVKTVRDLTGLDLREALAVVDRVEHAGADDAAMPDSPPHAGEELAQRVLDLATEGRKIEAIKEVRAATGSGLKEAKDIVDRVTGVQPATTSTERGMAVVLVGIALLLLGVVVIVMAAS